MDGQVCVGNNEQLGRMRINGTRWEAATYIGRPERVSEWEANEWALQFHDLPQVEMVILCAIQTRPLKAVAFKID